MARSVSERWVVFLIGAVQFVNILDFVMVMPLGPDFAKGLGIASSHIGTVSSSYTAAACVAGLAGTYFLDRFDRRKALAVAMLGLVIGTASGGLATGLYSLLAARVLAGCFGGPATALSFAIIADLIPPERRGKALGAVMGAFSVSSVVGVPLALKLAEGGNWRMPFFVVSAMGLMLAAGAIFLLPPIRGHLDGKAALGLPSTVAGLLKHPEVQLSYLITAVVMGGSFVLIPNISAYVQQNLGFPREKLWQLYFMGGLVSFASLRVAGLMVDRFGASKVGGVGSLLVAVCVWAGFMHDRSLLSIPLLFMAFMLAMGTRNVAYNTLTSKVPDNPVRARFMSLQSATQHMASAAGAFASSLLLVDRPDGKLGGMMGVAWVCLGASLLVVPLLYLLERMLTQRAQARALALKASQGLALPLSPEAGPPS